MSLLDQLNNDLKAAMLARDDARKRAIRSAKTAILNAQVEKRTQEGAAARLSEAEVLAVVVKEAKQRRDAIAEFEKASRTDLVEREQAELAILETYLPRQLAEEEIAAIVQEIIDAVGATSPKQIGLVMRPAMERLKGQADGRVVNQVVRQLLAASS